VRTKRIKEQGRAYYHVISRVVDRRFVFDDDEKERFRKIMRAVEAFTGVDVLTYANMDNHFHILLHVPDPKALSDDEVIERLRHLYTPVVVKSLAASLAGLRKGRATEQADAFMARYTNRMYDLSEFMKTLKQCVTQSYNARHKRKGTLWEERFKSLLVEGRGNALLTVAAYIDLNPVRAGLVDDPRHFRFCGYGEACGGSESARRGLTHIMAATGECMNWREAAARYRQMLYVRGEAAGVGENGHATQPGFGAVDVQSVLDAGGALPKAVLLRCRVRYFSDGAVMGSRAYVEDVFQRHREQFGQKRKTGARPMRGGDWGDLMTMRRLRSTPIRA
jgi:putative transposase